MKEAKGGNPNSSQTLSLAYLDSKDTEEEWKLQQHKDAQLLDRNFGMWHDHMISKGHAEQNKRDTMICDHMDPCKEAKFPDPTSPPLDYMKHCGVFKSKKTNKYDLCHFYLRGPSKISLSPQACHPQTVKQILAKGQGARASQPAMAICLFARTTHQRQPQVPAYGAMTDVGRKAIKKLSFCLLCMYSNSSNISYMNHIVCSHYCANYGCGQYLNEVFTTGQQLKVHLKVCMGLLKAHAGRDTPIQPFVHATRCCNQ